MAVTGRYQPVRTAESRTAQTAENRTVQTAENRTVQTAENRTAQMAENRTAQAAVKNQEGTTCNERTGEIRKILFYAPGGDIRLGA
ncbi:MAG: hypothetical protein LUC90_04420 [Lachnospiraceae bacterium]|nr:hypothetical protein [Lachnospiraceae bacterium]